jgi:hypothetical protein
MFSGAGMFGGPETTFTVPKDGAEACFTEAFEFRLGNCLALTIKGAWSELGTTSKDEN